MSSTSRHIFLYIAQVGMSHATNWVMMVSGRSALARIPCGVRSTRIDVKAV